MRSRSWVNRKGHDLKGKNEIQVMGNRKDHDLEEKNEIQVMEEQGSP